MRLTAEQAAVVRGIVARHLPHCEARVFGSRLREGGHPYSDLDLLLLGEAPIPLETLAALREAFELSPLPFLVDLVDGQRITPDALARFRAESEPLDTA